MKIYIPPSRMIIRAMLVLVFIAMNQTNLFSQVISGENNLCIGQTIIYQVPPGTSYPATDWQISPATASSINQYSNDEIAISWLNAGVYQISNINGGPSYSVTVYDPVSPFLTWDKEVGCTDFDYRIDNEGHVYIIDENQCTNACEYSFVTYTVNSQTIWYGSTPNYVWTIIGGEITAVNGVPLSSPYPTTYSGNETNLTIHWGAAGTAGHITIDEGISGVACANTEFQLCLNIIEIPEVDYVINSLIHPTGEGCVEVCLYSNLFFEGSAIVSPGSQIVSWKWDFDDTDPTQPQIVFSQNASHHFDTPGQYLVKLTVTNDCNCSNEIRYLICVSEEEMTNIICANPVCEGGIDNYTLENIYQCNAFQWLTPIGGSIIGSSTDPEVQIQWNSVDDDGFGYVILDGSDCGYTCPMDITLKVPVIKNQGLIKGETTVCVGESFIFELPAWPATNYYWEIIQNGTNAQFNTYTSLNVAQNSYMVEVFSGLTEGSYTLKCKYENTLTVPGCQGNASLEVLVRPKPQIDCLDRICNTDWDLDCNLTNIASVPPGTVWTLTRPDQTTMQLTGSSVTFPYTAFTVDGEYIVEASYPSVFCAPEPFVVEVIAPPPSPQDIHGDINVCLNVPYNYQVLDLLPNTVCYWEMGSFVGTPGTFNSAEYGNEVSITWTLNSPPIALMVYREWEDLVGCNSSASPGGIAVFPIQLLGSVSSSANFFCEDQSYPFELEITSNWGPAATPDSYFWSVVSTAAQVGSISSGQGTESCMVDFLHLGALTPCTIKCEVVKCGVPSTYTYSLDVEKSTEITAITIPTNPICSDYLFDIEIYWEGADPLEFYIDLGDGSLPTTYTCSGTPTSPISIPGFSITNNQGGSNYLPYNIVVQVKTSCNQLISDTESGTVNVYPLPGAILTPASPVMYCDPFLDPITSTISTTNGSTFQWYYNLGTTGNPGTSISGATNSIYNVTYTAPPGSIDGEYYCIVTDGNGCTQESNRRKIFYFCDSLCEPACVVSVDNMQTYQISCNEAYATCSITGTSCIVGFEWITDAPLGSYTIVNGPGTITTSPTFVFDDPGVYLITNTVECLNIIPNDPNCYVSGTEFIIIPYKADFTGGIVCNSSNSGYDIVVTDNSPVFPTALPIVNYTWSVNSTNFTYPSYSTTVSGSYIIELEVSGGLYSCFKEETFVVPDLPVASFDVLTTYGDPANPNKSCEERTINFTNTSTSTVGIAENFWDFEDITYSYIESPGKTYIHDGTYPVRHPNLKVTDIYGCHDDAYTNIEIFENSFERDQNNQYTNSPQNLCQGEIISLPINPQLSLWSPYTPYQYQWYFEEELLSGITSSSLSGLPPAGSGQYWVSILDANYCYFNNNQAPAIVSVMPVPTAIIDGDPDICEGEDIHLTAITGFPASANLTYLWESTPALTLPNAKSIDIINPTSQSYSITLTVTDNTSGCFKISNPFEINKYPLPPAPTIDYGNIDCQNYIIQLSGNIDNIIYDPQLYSLHWPLSYNWSNGGLNINTNVFTGGLYRFWITDKHGCKNYSEINVPEDPSYYFWRFPKDACPCYCQDNLPRSIDGPTGIDFEYWDWLYFDNVLFNPFSSGTGVSDPLIIELQPMGPGEYAWGLENLLPGNDCYKRVDPFSWCLIECCNFDAEVYIYCSDGELNEYAFDIDIASIPCANPSVNLVIMENGSPNGSINVDNLTSSYTFNGGGMQITGTFEEHFPSSTSVSISITINCPNESCSNEYTINLPSCGSQQSAQINPSADIANEIGMNILPEVLLYPNPVNSTLKIDYNISPNDVSTANSITLRCIDAMGRMLILKNLPSLNGTETINLENLNQGLYHLQILMDGELVSSKRFVIVR